VTEYSPPDFKVAHSRLQGTKAVILGEIHLILEQADCETEKGRPQPVDPSRDVEAFTLEELRHSPLEEGIGLDAIRWWVTKRDSNPEELLARTEQIIPVVGRVKESAQKIRIDIKSYEDIIDNIVEFSERNEKDLASILAYVEWLRERATLAPLILYDYRSWGTTRLSEQRARTGNQLVRDSDSLLKCTEIVVGLRRLGYTIHDVDVEMIDEIFSSARDMDAPPPLPQMEAVLTRTAYKVRHRLFDYLDCLQRAMRNVVVEIKTLQEDDAEAENPEFWSDFIKWSSEQPVETELWDFKATLDIWHVPGDKKAEADLELAEDVASFANARGGVIIVGVTNKEPRQIVGIGQNRLEERIIAAKESIMRHVDRPVDFIRICVVPLILGGKGELTCLALAIKRTSAPVGVRDQTRRFAYAFKIAAGKQRLTWEAVMETKKDLSTERFAFIPDLRMRFAASGDKTNSVAS